MGFGGFGTFGVMLIWGPTLFAALAINTLPFGTHTSDVVTPVGCQYPVVKLILPFESAKDVESTH